MCVRVVMCVLCGCGCTIDEYMSVCVCACEQERESELFPAAASLVSELLDMKQKD